MITARTVAHVGTIIPIAMYIECVFLKSYTAELKIKKITFTRNDRMGVTICSIVDKSNVKLDIFNTLLQINSKEICQ